MIQFSVHRIIWWLWWK